MMSATTRVMIITKPQVQFPLPTQMSCLYVFIECRSPAGQFYLDLPSPSQMHPAKKNLAEDIQMATKYMETGSASFTIREIGAQITR